MKFLVCDFEFGQDSNGLPDIRCAVFMDQNNLIHRYWIDELSKLNSCPFLDEETIFICFYALAEMACFHQLGWPLPAKLIDLYLEFSIHVNVNGARLRKGLVDALSFFNLNGSFQEKDDMRSLALRGGPYTTDEKNALLDYCEKDVNATRKILRELCEI